HTRFSRDWSSDVCSSDLSTVGFATLDAPAEFERRHSRVSNQGRATNSLRRSGMFIAPCIIRKNIASRKWPRPPPRGEGIFGRSRSEERRVGKEWRGRWWG